jgi:uncharacterized membrane protein
MTGHNSNTIPDIRELLKYFIGCVILFVLDQIWIKITYDSHKQVIEKVQQGKKFKKRYIPFYIAIVLLLVHFILLIRHNSSIFEGALHGFILHGIINSYNYAYFEDYDLTHAFIETIYGTCVIAFVLFIVQTALKGLSLESQKETVQTIFSNLVKVKKV